jgi:hypothetical protein
MNPHEFVEAVYAAVYRTAIDGVLRILAHPPGRRPRQDVADLSAWFNRLSEEDKDCVRGVVRLAVDQTVFGMLAVLDGVRSVGLATDLELRGDGVDLVAEHDLHDLFRNRVDQELGYD